MKECITHTLPGLKACGSSCYFHGDIHITCPRELQIGDNVHISPGGHIDARGGVTIGDNVHIGRNLALYSYSHNYEGGALPYDDTWITKPVYIGDNVWIGMNVCIIPGVTIGEGAVIGLGAVVTRDIPALAIAGVQPTRIIKYRDSKHYHALKQAGKFGGRAGVPL